MSTPVAGRKKNQSHFVGATWSVLPATPALIFIFFIFIAPISVLLLRSVTDPQLGFQNYKLLFADLFYMNVLVNTFSMSAAVTFTSLLLAFPVAWTLVLLKGRASQLIFAVIMISAWTSLLAKVFSLLILLQDTGVVNYYLLRTGIVASPLPLIHNFGGVLVGMTYIMIPYVILPIYSTMSTIDPTILQAASVCGARPTRVFFTTLLPLSVPGISTGCILCFILCLGYFVVPAMLGSGRNMLVAQLVFEQVQSFLHWGLGSAAAFFLLAITLILYAVYLKTIGLEVQA